MKQNPKSKAQRFKFNEFWVEIPASIGSKYNHLAADEEIDILDSLGKIFTRLERKLNAAESEPMLLNGEIRNQLAPPIPDEYQAWFTQSIKAALNPQTTEMPKYPNALSDSQTKDKALELLKFCEFRRLHNEPTRGLLKKATTLAIESDDHGFFKKLGRTLERQPHLYGSYKPQTPLQKLLIKHWITRDKRGLQFCCFTAKALCEFLNTAAKECSPTSSSISKTIERLGLKSTRKKLVKQVIVNGDTIQLA